MVLCLGFWVKVYGLGFRVYGLGFRVWGMTLVYNGPEFPGLRVSIQGHAGLVDYPLYRQQWSLPPSLPDVGARATMGLVHGVTDCSYTSSIRQSVCEASMAVSQLQGPSAPRSTGNHMDPFIFGNPIVHQDPAP